METRELTSDPSVLYSGWVLRLVKGLFSSKWRRYYMCLVREDDHNVLQFYLPSSWRSNPAKLTEEKRARVKLKVSKFSCDLGHGCEVS